MFKNTSEFANPKELATRSSSALMDKVATSGRHAIINDNISHLQFLNMLSQIINIYFCSFKGKGGRKRTDIESLNY